MESISKFSYRNTGTISFAIGIILLPLILGSGFYLNVMIFIAIYSITAIGLCLLTGYTGQLSIAHAAFFGIGAYSSGILTSRFGLPSSLVFFISIVWVGIVAYLIGIVVLRFKSHYLAIVTLSVAVIVEVIIKELSSITGGAQGLSGIPYFSLGRIVFDSEMKLYYLCWSILLCILIFSLNLVNSKIGRALKATKEGEEIARIMGINTPKYKNSIFVLSSIYAALAGSLYAHYVTFITPQVAGLPFAFEIILMIAFGGFTNIWGSLFGVAGISFLSEYLRGFAEYKLAIYGFALVVIMLFFPSGLLQGLKDYASLVLGMIRQREG